MKITDENFDKYNELYRIYNWKINKEELKKTDKDLYKKYQVLNKLMYIVPTLLLVGLTCFDITMVPLKDFAFAITGSVCAAAALALGSYININMYIKERLIDKFEDDNPNLEIMPKQELKRKLSRYLRRSIDKNKSMDLEVVEIKDEDLVDDYDKERKLRRIPKNIDLDFKLSSNFYTPDEKIAFLEAEKEFWLRAKERESQNKPKQLKK